jgi:hypothetical protein
LSVHAGDVLWWRELFGASRPLDTAMLLATIAEVDRLEQLRLSTPPKDAHAQRVVDVESLTRAYDPGAIRLATFMGMVAVLADAGAVRETDAGAVIERAVELAAEQQTFPDREAIRGVVRGLLGSDSRELFARDVLGAAVPPPSHERIEEDGR